MKKIKAQALALVLIIVVLAIIVVLSVTSRVMTDIRQQGLERASTRAETIAESAVDNITQQIQNGQIRVQSGTDVKIGIGNITPSGSTATPLNLCQNDATDLSKRCENESNVRVLSYDKIIRFKINNSENLEGHFFDAGVVGVKTGNDSRMIVSTSDNDSIDETRSSLLVKAFARETVSGTTIVKLVGECVWNISGSGAATASCIPGSLAIQQLASCPDPARYGTKCMLFRANAGYGVSFWRVKALLKEESGNPNPFVELSLLGADGPAYDFPVPQMAFLRAGVYTGNQGNQQGVFQETNRLMLLHPSVPESVDYVLYNGSGNPVVK
ncbi:MAG: hypothetical protein QY314_04460 [Candidatus Dojkabacteria bacterium]|nr:MAG: hypothetical protein QY314_04460 [Candidatus Dojkabacteria bacterium]